MNPIKYIEESDQLRGLRLFGQDEYSFGLENCILTIFSVRNLSKLYFLQIVCYFASNTTDADHSFCKIFTVTACLFLSFSRLICPYACLTWTLVSLRELCGLPCILRENAYVCLNQSQLWLSILHESIMWFSRDYCENVPPFLGFFSLVLDISVWFRFKSQNYVNLTNPPFWFFEIWNLILTWFVLLWQLERVSHCLLLDFSLQWLC